MVVTAGSGEVAAAVEAEAWAKTVSWEAEAWVKTGTAVAGDWAGDWGVSAVAGERRALVTRAVTGGPAHFRSCTQVGKARGPSCGAIPMRGWHHIQSWRSPTHWHALLPVIDETSLPHS